MREVIRKRMHIAQKPQLGAGFGCSLVNAREGLTIPSSQIRMKRIVHIEHAIGELCYPEVLSVL